jgi:hypothetical protein
MPVFLDGERTRIFQEAGLAATHPLPAVPDG